MQEGEENNPFRTFEEIIYKYLTIALDCGITEDCFWNMTIAEINRYTESYSRKKQNEAKEKAAFDYIQAGLIGRFVASHFSKMSIPTIEEVYSSLFIDTEEIERKKQEKQKAINELSALRFKEFANSFNKRYQNKEANKQ